MKHAKSEVLYHQYHYRAACAYECVTTRVHAVIETCKLLHHDYVLPQAGAHTDSVTVPLAAICPFGGYVRTLKQGIENTTEQCVCLIIYLAILLMH